MSVNLLFDNEAEQAVIGSIFLDQQAARIAAEILKSDDFYNYSNKKIFEAVIDLLDKKSAVDVVTVKNWLEEKGEFDKIGATAYLVEISTCVGTSVNVKHYAEIVQEKAMRRNILHMTNEAGKLAQNGDFVELLNKIETIQKLTIQQNSGLTPITETVAAILQQAMEHQKSGLSGKCTGLQTGFYDLDAYTGGFQKNNLIILAARPSMGKTALALDIIVGATKKILQKESNIVFFSLEMSKEQITKRICSSEMKISNDKFKLLTFDSRDAEKMEYSIQSLEKISNKIYIDDTAAVNTRYIYSKCHTLRAKSDCEIGLIVIDYLQLMTGNKSSTRQEEISGISRELKNIAKEFQCPVLALSQLSRACEQRADHRPMLSDLRESGAIEQDADIVMFLYRDDYYFPETERKNQAELIIAKQRDGATGTIYLRFLNDLTTFKNLKTGYY